ncbi:PREDICTED: uncharacterized protein LOC105316405 [Amphimedon queenslandica]|uniref:EF-hand domain-containing protein n=1 Tax=Amphimedon queenslandica TaxID=400682 RepID=A0A1X7VQI9_AMPQE|nr:PREDICTED: uncharacterized protein LOC105316405 [Amphimedon queenslandica]|eukprot:XP_011409560.1 PREDICTED: uncharacterized protein LOC105316405 [Amphimedon queenslandica]
MAATEAAEAYLSAHHIPELLEQLASWVLYNTPDDPKAFIIDHLQQMKEKKEGLPLLDEENLKAMFRMLDIQTRGYISLEQYTHAMLNVGLVKFNKEPIGGQSNKITQDTFLHEANRALRKANQAFCEP